MSIRHRAKHRDADLVYNRIEHVDLFSHFDLDGLVCQSLGSTRSPSEILSQYVGRPCHLIMKGPRTRICEGTADFPKIDNGTRYQDGYPLLLLSEESIQAVQDKVRTLVGVQGVEEKWKNDKLLIERFVSLSMLPYVYLTIYGCIDSGRTLW